MPPAPGADSCLRCGGVLEAGYLLDQSYATEYQTQWVSGDAVRGWFGMKTKGRRTLPVTARRCRTCGTLDLRVQPGD